MHYVPWDYVPNLILCDILILEDKVKPKKPIVVIPVFCVAFQNGPLVSTKCILYLAMLLTPMFTYIN